MTVPGSNLLNRAARLIKQQPVDYYQDIGRTTNEIGLDVTSYAPPIEVLGSVQAVPLSAYKELGLDFGKNYINFYTKVSQLGVQRDASGDVIVFGGRTYQCQSTTNWLSMDGWNSVLAVEIELTEPELHRFVITPQTDFVILPES